MGRCDQCLADVRADDLAVRSAELVDELALAVEQVGGPAGQPVLRPNVNGEEVALGARGHAGRSADEALAARPNL